MESKKNVTLEWDATPGGLYAPGWAVTQDGALWGRVHPELDGQFLARRIGPDGLEAGGVLCATLDSAAEFLVAE